MAPDSGAIFLFAGTYFVSHTLMVFIPLSASVRVAPGFSVSKFLWNVAAADEFPLLSKFASAVWGSSDRLEKAGSKPS